MKRLLLALLFSVIPLRAAVTVSTAQYDNSRSGANTSETILTQSLVSSNFGKLCTHPADGYVYGQPLIIDGVSIKGATRVLLFETTANSIYLFNADTCDAALWTINLGKAASAIDSIFVSPTIGCLATAVIDTGTNVIYSTCDLETWGWYLFSWKLADGSPFHAPVKIKGHDDNHRFYSSDSVQRPGLLLSSGKIYLAWAGQGDAPYRHPWVMAYNKTNLRQTDIIDLAISGDSGIWMSGGGLAADGSGNIYCITGNGPWNGTTNFGNSFVKLSSSLDILNFMTPATWATLNTYDYDLGSGRVILHGNYVIGGGKEGYWYLLNQGALGGLEGSGPALAQKWIVSPGDPNGGVWGGEAFANDTLFLAPRINPIKAYSFNGSQFNPNPKWSTLQAYQYPGGALSYSSNGSMAGTDILWSVGATSAGDEVGAIMGTLRAFNATTGDKIYDSDTAIGDILGNLAKFNAPTIANGRVFVGTANSVTIYGQKGE